MSPQPPPTPSQTLSTITIPNPFSRPLSRPLSPWSDIPTTTATQAGTISPRSYTIHPSLTLTTLTMTDDPPTVTAHLPTQPTTPLSGGQIAGIVLSSLLAPPLLFFTFVATARFIRRKKTESRLRETGAKARRERQERVDRGEIIEIPGRVHVTGPEALLYNGGMREFDPGEMYRFVRDMRLQDLNQHQLRY